MLRLAEGTRIYVAAGVVDFRKAINGLSALVIEQFERPVNDGSVYVFYNRDCTRVKCLFWDKNGFVLYHKRLERWDPEPNIKTDIQWYFLSYQHQDLPAETVCWKNSDLILQKPADIDTQLSLSQQDEIKLFLRTDWLQLKQNSTGQTEYIQALIYILTGVINDHLNEFSLET